MRASAALAESSPLGKDLSAFRRALLRWYDQDRRDLPWRRTRDPYRIWLSEIMLQQTRVAAVLEHYRLFLERFPDIPTLAGASESAVLAAWSGLGYYRRARMLRQCAQKIMTEHRGRFPQTSEALQTLPGINSRRFVCHRDTPPRVYVQLQLTDSCCVEVIRERLQFCGSGCRRRKCPVRDAMRFANAR